MKRYMALLMSMLLVFSCAACGRNTDYQQETTGTLQAESSEPSTSPETEPVVSSEPLEVTQADNGEAEKTLIVYFSWSSAGNTKKMAATIQEETGGTIYEIIPLNAYPSDYTATTEVAQEEKDSNARPEIRSPLESVSEYDKILIGYPIWWHTAPMIIGTFLESYDLTGIDVYPFSQSASMNEEQFEESMAFVRSCAEGANVHDGLFVSADETDSIIQYLRENGLTE